MKRQSAGKYIAIALIGVTLLALTYLFRAPLTATVSHLYHFLSDREQVKTFISGFGAAAPLVFMAIQILQVLFAPVPGEATGFIGGFLFGTFKGFIYSSIALGVGSLLNFLIGRFMGKRYVRKLIPEQKLRRFDTFINRQGLFVLLILFIFPGFPKDYLCLFLGISAISLKAFILIAAFGRMPGTFMLSLQGASLFDKNYAVLLVTAALCILAVVFMYLYRERLYGWLEKVNGNKGLGKN